MVASGMERGVHDSGERLAELLARLQGNQGNQDSRQLWPSSFSA